MVNPAVGPKLKRRKHVQWASWNFPARGREWPSYQEVLQKPPGLRPSKHKLPDQKVATAHPNSSQHVE